MSRLGRWIRRVGFVLLVLLVLALALRLVLSSVANRRLESALAAARASGAPLTVAEAAPPPVPPSENAAELLLEAERILEGTDFLSDERMAFDEAPLETDDAVLASVERWLARAAPALDLLEAAAARPACRFDGLWEEPASRPALVHPLGWHRWHYLRRRAYVQIHRGALDDALDTLALQVRLADLTAQTPLLVATLWHGGQLVGTIRTLEAALSRGQPGAASLARLKAAFSAPPRLPSLPEVLRADRAVALGLFEEAWRRGAYEGIEDAEKGIFRRLLHVVAMRALIRMDQAVWVEAYGSASDLAGRPWHETQAAWEALAMPRSEPPWTGGASRSVGVMLRTVALRQVESEALRRMAGLALHLEGRLARGDDLPESLAALPLDIVDPLTGRALGYRRTDAGRGYRLWAGGEAQSAEGPGPGDAPDPLVFSRPAR